MAPRKERAAPDPEGSEPEVEDGDSGAPLDEVLEMLQHKRAEMHMQGIGQLLKLLDRNSEPDFLEARSSELGYALAACFRKGRDEEQATVLQLLCKLIILGGRGGVALSILGQFPQAFLSSQVSSLSSRLSSPVLPYAVTALALYVLFLSGDDDQEADLAVVRILSDLAARALGECTGVRVGGAGEGEGDEEGDEDDEKGDEKGEREGSGSGGAGGGSGARRPARGRAPQPPGERSERTAATRTTASRTTAARSVTTQVAARISALGDLCDSLFSVLSALALVGRDFLVGYWVSDDQHCELMEQAMGLNDPRLSEAVGGFVVTLNACELAEARAELEREGQLGAWEEDLPQTQTQAYFAEVFELAGAVFGRGISKRSKRALHETFADLAAELQAGRYGGETVQLRTRESLHLATRDMANRYALVSTVLGESVHLAAAGNASVRAFLELPPPQACHVLVAGVYAGEKSVREERASRAAARREKEQRRREK